MPTTVTNLSNINSTSYADVAGVQRGMQRIPGESTTAFVARMRSAAAETRNHTYEGVVNAIAFSLGLTVSPGIMIDGPDDTTVTCDLSGITLVSGAQSLTLPLATFGADDVWTWNSLSSLVSSINATPTWSATLLAADGPAVQLCRQTNTAVGMPYECVVSEVGLISLTEASAPALAVAPSGSLAYQVHEILQAIMAVDLSYWTE